MLLDHENEIASGSLLRRSEGARTEELITQAVAGLELMALAADGDFELALEQKQMMLEAGLRHVVISDARARSKLAEEAWQRNKCRETPAAVPAPAAAAAKPAAPAPAPGVRNAPSRSGSAVY